MLCFNWFRKRLLNFSAGPKVKLLVERGKVLGKQIGTEAHWMMPKCAAMDLLILFRVVIYLFILYNLPTNTE